MTQNAVGFPGESDEYRRERNRLLEAEIELRRAIERGGKMVRQRLGGSRCVVHRLAAVLVHLHGGADADRQHEGDDENRNGATQHRLGGEKAPVRGVGNRLRHAPDRIRP